ncbi:MAG: hypothetical protein ACLT9J_10830 [Agathobacter rectalis]
MQLMPSTAAALGVSNSYDARENIMGGAKYISPELLSNYREISPFRARRLQCPAARVWFKCGWHPAFYRDTELRHQKSTLLSYMEEFGSAVSSTVSSVSRSSFLLFSI